MPPDLAIARFSAAFGVDLMLRIIAPLSFGSQAALAGSGEKPCYNLQMTTLGSRIRAARSRLKPKLTLEVVAEKMGVTVAAVQQWETDGTVPRQQRMQKLAAILKVPVAWLDHGKGPPPSEDDMQTRFERLSPESQQVLLDAMWVLEQRQQGNDEDPGSMLANIPKPKKSTHQ